MIVVSDGVTQFLSDAICVDIVSRFTDPSDAAEALVKEASDRWLSKSDYRDDITALVVFLDIPALQTFTVETFTQKPVRPENGVPYPVRQEVQ